MEREECPTRNGKILPARLAALARCAVRLAAVVDDFAPAIRAHRAAVRRAPPDAAEARLGFLIGHAQHGAQGERPGLC
jgi:hypothetical protein